jgi:DNA-binding NarL/FixJ family response regulator
MNVILVDDHQIFRDGLKRIFSEERDIKIIGEAGDAAGLFEILRKKKPDVLVLDINLPGRGGVDILHEVKRDFPKVPVLVLTMYPEAQYAVRAMKAGASGYLTKTMASAELITAVRKIERGGKYINQTVADQMAEALQHDDAQGEPHKLLSDREFQVFRLIASGKTVGEIADALALSVKTISTYRTHIIEKMNLRNNADMMRYATEHGLFE